MPASPLLLCRALVLLIIQILQNHVVAQNQACAFTQCADRGLVAVKSNNRPVSNGCSVPSFIQLPDFQFEKCCDQHDSCYQACGISKNSCETHFGRCLKEHCKAVHAGNSECTQTADTFVMGVKMFGCNGYQESQEASCDCVEKDYADTHRQGSLTNFYANYNESKTAGDIASALQKNKGKEGAMWRALYSKYPESIEIISRDGQASTESGRGSEL